MSIFKSSPHNSNVQKELRSTAPESLDSATFKVIMFGKSLEGRYCVLRIKDRSVGVDSYNQTAVNVLMKAKLQIRMRD